MIWDRCVMVDWSGGADRGLSPKKDSIWIGQAVAGQSEPPEYCRNRVVAEERLAEIISAARDTGERLLIGFDFPFGYPTGFASAVSGSPDPLALWAELARRLPASVDGRERMDVAAELNALFPDEGPFWFDVFKTGAVPSKKPLQTAVAEWRAVEGQAKGAFSCWQLGGAGSVGSQALMGIPVLERLRQRFDVSVWPFEALDTQVAFVEIWPSLIAQEIAQSQAVDEIKDAAQVRVVAQAVSRLSPSEFTAMLEDVPKAGRMEGWIFGLGHETALAGAARQGRLRNDCFALPPGVDWAPVEDALALLRARLGPVTDEETIQVWEAACRVLARDVTALRAHPPAANSAVDGYGLSEGLPSGLHHIPLAQGRAAAGAPFKGQIPEGSALRILTGATLPEGVTTVLLEEDCRVTDTSISVEGPLKRGANARSAGEDVKQGATLLAAGRVLTPADLALLSATGHGTAPVRKRLRVAILSTGDELREPGRPLQSGQIADANRPMLAALVRGLGHDVLDLGICQDDRSALSSKFDRAAAEADVLLTSGGASAGEEDHVSALLTQSGSMAMWRIAIKPGRPLALGLWKGCPVFGLPGNPVAAMVCSLIFARPALAQLAGASWSEPLAIEVPAAFSKRKKAGRREYLRARLVEGRAKVFASEGSGRISGLSWADGLVELPHEAVEIRPGMPVRYLPFSGLFA